MELAAEGSTPDYMSLPAIKFKLSLIRAKNDEDAELKKRLLEGIEKNAMAPYYRQVCNDLGWSFDRKLFDEMSAENKKRLESFREDDSETPVWQDR
jgi:hypothetical protein